MLAQQSRILVDWEPEHPRQFVVASQDIRLYALESSAPFFSTSSSSLSFQVNDPPPLGADGTRKRSTENKDCLILKSAISALQNTNCFAWVPGDGDRETALAVGLTSGTVVLNTIGAAPEPLKEFVPRNSRVCNAVSWNRNIPTQLAAGLDKVRSDFSTFVWDITQQSSNSPKPTPRRPAPTRSLSSFASSRWPSSSNSAQQPQGDHIHFHESSFSISPGVAAETITKPYRELANSESTVALSWAPDSGFLLAAGTGTKWLRVYDVREDAARPNSVVAHSKTVLGVKFDPFQPHRVATFSEEGDLKIWDIRQLSPDPVFSMDTGSNSPLIQIEWCPTRAGILATIARDDRCVKFWDIKDACFNTPIEVSTASGSRKSSELRGLVKSASSSSSTSVASSVATSSSSSLSAITTSAKGATSKSASSLRKGQRRKSGLISPSAGDDGAVVESAFISMNKPVKTHFLSENPSCIAWHPSNSYRILVAGQQGGLQVLSLHESLPMAWSPRGWMLFAHGNSLTDANVSSGAQWASASTADRASQLQDINRSPNSFHIEAEESLFSEIDAAVQMRLRAENGYCCDARTNCSLPGLSEDLLAVWTWIENVNRMSAAKREQLALSQVFASPHTRSTVLEPQRTGNALDCKRSGHVLPTIFPAIYTSSSRDFALQVCGWKSSAADEETPIDRLVHGGEHTRASFIALVSDLDLPRAIRILSEAPLPSQTDLNTSDNLPLLAMALAGAQTLGTGNATLWSETCRTYAKNMRDPYLRVLFSLLCPPATDGGGMDRFLLSSQQMQGILLPDRIALACRLLNDKQLSHFCQALARTVVEQGRVDGLLFTGFGDQGLALLERYVDHTTDVQTAALLCHRMDPSDHRIETWVEGYRELLDRWQLWHVRARFDGARRHTSNSRILQPQVFVRCNYCNKSLSLSSASKSSRVQSKSRYGSGGLREPSSQTELPSCPTCNKPLPHCSVCLLPFTSVSLPGPKAAGDKTEKGAPPRGFESWFTWCQTCRHGGHAGHLLEWFAVNSTCPVA
eukprot:CAMPEP_0174238428 /NCGR_PEP_ID=MMETSP0417-20130205/11187_1 /TAXON_ID=242541 /ORGANISM="Mayorella sp, Strain BSH-02190019" /LENGTH=1029 /DNA_ID=CAMNT_0015317259 /DNA_START=92 /DNA_END=3177 /DNA_ORIENTATION=+